MVKETDKGKTNRGNCYTCDWYDSKIGLCRHADALGHLSDIRCLIKLQTILLRDIALTLKEYVYEDGEDTDPGFLDNPNP